MLLLSRSLSNSFSFCGFITELLLPRNYLNFPITSVIVGLGFSYELGILFTSPHEIKLGVYLKLLIFFACMVLK